MKTVALNGRDIDRVVIWAGATLQAPHRAMAAQRGIAPYGVFVSFFFYGSPATHYGLYAGRRITEVDGQPTPDLDAFIKAVRGKPDRASLRLKTVSWNGMTDVITLKLDKHYWPAYELDRQSDGSWRRTALDPDPDMTRGARALSRAVRRSRRPREPQLPEILRDLQRGHPQLAPPCSRTWR